MSELDFYIEFSIEIPNVEDELLDVVSQELRALSDSRKDLIGASVGLEDIAGVEEMFLYLAKGVAH